DTGHIITSANGTWIDRAELAALRRSRKPSVISTMYGHIAETFSAGAMAGLAATLLRKAMPPMRSRDVQTVSRIRFADGIEPPDDFAAICTDYTGLAAGVRIEWP